MISRFFIKNENYASVLKRQQTEFDLRVACRKNGMLLPDDTILFVEHRPVYTLGRHADKANVLISMAGMKQKGIELHEIGRGGDVTYHGPGQLTVYPIIDLLRYGLGVKSYINLLEESVIQTLSEYRVCGERIEGKTGVWIGKGSERERKICAIGVKCSRFITMHGLALNVGSDVSGFSGIVPCGLRKDVTSISLERGEETEWDEVAEKLWLHLTRLLQLHIPSPKSS